MTPAPTAAPLTVPTPESADVTSAETPLLGLPGEPSVVHLATEWEPHIRDQIKRLTNKMLSMRSVGTEKIGLALMLVVVLPAILFLINAGWRMAIIILALMLIATWGHVLGKRQLSKSRERQFSTHFPESSDPARRIRMIGDPHDLRQVVARSHSIPMHFEPASFRVACAVELTKYADLKQAAVVVVGVAAAVVCYGAILPVRELSLIMHMGTIGFGCLIARLIRLFLWPTYLRLAPGRLDIFQYNAFGHGTPRVRTYDLRTCRVAFQVHGPIVLFHPDALNGELLPAATDRFTQEAPYAFELTLLAACLTTAPTPPLPDDRLDG